MRPPSIGINSKEAIMAAEQMAARLRENIADLTARQRAEERRAPLSERVANRITSFTGSMTFVVIHLAAYGAWIAVNLGAVPGAPAFDPTFVVLAMEASVEAIFLSTFVLISQNRMAAAADRRADLDLHINLLAEHELTKLAGLLQQIAAKLEIAADDPQLREIEKDVEPGEVLDVLDAGRRGAGLRG
jgi:uncharacterized membrane protein